MTALILGSLGFIICFVISLMAQQFRLEVCIIRLAFFICISDFLSLWYGFILRLIYGGMLLVKCTYDAALIPNILVRITLYVALVGFG